MKKKKSNISQKFAALTLTAALGIGGALGLVDYHNSQDDNYKRNNDDDLDASHEFVIKNPERSELPDGFEFAQPDGILNNEDLVNAEVADAEAETVDVAKDVETDKNTETKNSDIDLESVNNHQHTIGERVALNDYFEANYCSEDNVLMGIKLHNYRITDYKKVSNDNGTHNTTLIFTCVNCNHERTLTSTVDCEYGKVTWDDIFEYENCEGCGYKHIIGKHKLDNGTIDYEKGTITYACENPRCEYVKENKYELSKPGNSGSTSSGYEKPVRPGHIHYLGEWVALDDDLEANYCPKDGVLVDVRNHKYEISDSISKSNGNGTHATFTEETCTNCKHIKTSTKTNSCDYDFKWNDLFEYNECTVCGDVKIIGSHRLDKGTINTADNTITYACENEGCGYSKTESYTKPVDPVHKHTMGAYIDNGSNEIRYCTDPNCPDPNRGSETRAHSWGNYKYKDDSTEERECNTCTAISTKGHSYTNDTSYTIVDDSHHTRTVTRNCSSCNDSKIVDTFENEDCSFTIFVGETDADITYKCACGNTKTVDKTEEHTHKFGNWKNNGSNEVGNCIVPGCPDPDAKEYKAHAWGEWNADHTERPCATCDAKEKHDHTFGADVISTVPNGETSHDVVVSHTCTDDSCNHKEEVSRKTEACSFTIFVSETDTTITKGCECGNKFTENKNIGHNHTYGDYINNGLNEIRYCTDPNCPVPGGDANTRDHSWGEWNADHTERVCETCDAKETHNHSMTTNNTDTPSGDKTHIHTVTQKCDECGEEVEVSSEEVNCNFTKGKEVTDETTGITTITYSCVCGNSYTETKGPVTHTHAGGNLQERAGSGNTCYETYKVCDECGEEYDISSHGHNLIDGDRGKKECLKCGKTFSASETLTEQATLQNPPLATDIPAVGDVIADGDTLVGVIAGSEQTDASQTFGEGETQEPEKVIIVVDENNEDKIDEIIAEQEPGKDIILIVDDEAEKVDQIISEQDQVISDAQAEAEARLEEILASDANEVAKDEAIDKIIEDTERVIGEAIAKADAEFADLIDDDPMVRERIVK